MDRLEAYCLLREQWERQLEAGQESSPRTMAINNDLLNLEGGMGADWRLLVVYYHEWLRRREPPDTAPG
jgi:hypothetical protein